MILASELPGAKIIFYEFLENMLERSRSDLIQTLDIEERTLGLPGHLLWLTKDEVDIVYIISVILLHHSYNIHNSGQLFLQL